MNKISIFAVYDIKSKFFRFKFEKRTTGEAIRVFTEGANEKESEIGKYPQDFALYRIAEYDDQSGTYLNISPPRVSRFGCRICCSQTKGGNSCSKSYGKFLGFFPL